MSEWGDQNVEEFYDEEKVGSKRPRGSRGLEAKLAQQARTLRRRAERAEGHLNATKPRYRLGTMNCPSKWCCASQCQNGTSTTPGRPYVVGSRAAPGRAMQWHESRLLRRARTKPNATFTSSATSCDRRRESSGKAGTLDKVVSSKACDPCILMRNFTGSKPTNACMPETYILTQEHFDTRPASCRDE